MRFGVTVLLIGIVSCATGSKAAEPAGGAGGRTQMRSSVREVCENLNRVVQEATDEIARRSPDVERKRLAVQWKIYTIAASRRALVNPNPYSAFLDLWAMAAQRRDLLEREGDALLGDVASVAREANDEFLAYLERVAAKVFPPQVLAPTKAEVESFAAAHPITGGTRRWFADTGEESRGESIFGAVAKLAPSLGIKDTAASIEDVARSIDAIGEIVGDLPLLARWNMALLLYDLHENPTIVGVREDLHDVSGSVGRFVEMADGLPERLQGELAKTLDGIDAKQEGVRQTLGEARAAAQEARAAVEALRAAVKEADATTRSAERATEAFARAGREWQPVAAALREILGPASEEPGPPGPDPDIENLVRVAREASTTAERLHAALAEMRALLDGAAVDRLNENVRGTVDRSSDRLRDLVDHATWRAMLLALAVALVAVAYRAATGRLRRT